VVLAALLALVAAVVTVLAVLGITPVAAILPPGRLLLGVAAVVLAALATQGALARPRLRADTDGVTVRGLRSTHSWPWASVRYRLRRTSRLGRKQTTLELDGTGPDGTEQLVVLGRIDLGTDPVDVCAALDELRAGQAPR
jgi:hypothetical protein